MKIFFTFISKPLEYRQILAIQDVFFFNSITNRYHVIFRKHWFLHVPAIHFPFSFPTNLPLAILFLFLFDNLVKNQLG